MPGRVSWLAPNNLFSPLSLCRFGRAGTGACLAGGADNWDSMGEESKKQRRSVYLLPNMLTTLSMFFGFLAIIWAIQGRYEPACLAILFSTVMDCLDGKVARMTNTASEFGVQYDSLSDLVAFGVAPAILAWQWQLVALGRVGIAATFVYAACGALRLARFNISSGASSTRFFIGLPIPMGACTVVSFVLLAPLLPDFMSGILPYFSFVLMVGLGVLMVSRVRYFSFKEYDFFRAHPIRVMLIFLFILGAVVSAPRFMAFALSSAYIVGGLVYTFILLPRRNRQVLRVLSHKSE